MNEEDIEALVAALPGGPEVSPRYAPDEWPLDDELRYYTGRDPAATEGVALYALELPLLHRVGPRSLRDFLNMLEDPLRSLELVPGEGGSEARRTLQEGLAEAPGVYFWVGHCAYRDSDPDLLFVWAASAEDSEPGGMAAPWDTAGLTTKMTLGRNLTHDEAVDTVRRYSLPLRRDGASPYRRYLAAMLACSYDAPEAYQRGDQPRRRYPGWSVDPPRENRGGSRAEMAHHTFEVRRFGQVSLSTGLLGIFVKAAVLAKSRGARRRLETLARSAVWEEGRRLHRVEGDGKTTLGEAHRAVERYLRERGAT